MIMGRTVLASNESLSPTHPFTLNMVRNEYQAEGQQKVSSCISGVALAMPYGVQTVVYSPTLQICLFT